jgi:Abortive infection C-terminus
MITLYSGSGAQDFAVSGDAMPAEHWNKLKGTAIRLLRTRGQQRASDILEQIPFELRDGSNGFNDEFSVLYWRAPLERYVKAADWSESKGDRAPFEQIAKVVTEIASTTYIRFIAVDIDTEDGPAAVKSPSLAITSDVVERALKDAENLIGTSGAESAVDRVHTALHGYLKEICDDSSLPYGPDPTITQLFKIVRTQHPAFSATIPYADEVRRVANAFASAIDALNTIRNNATPAHPNDAILEAPEAMLMINAVRTLLHYLNAKLR